MAASFLQTQWAYWLCQLGGWGGVAALGWMMDSLQRLSTPSLSSAQDHFFLPLTCIAGFAVTDLLRRIIKGGRWLELSPSKIILRYAAALLTSSLFLSFCGTFLFASPPARETRMETFTVALLANSSLVGAWMAIYFLLHFYEAFHHAREERALLKEAYMASQLEALSLQLNPHFLFNALNTIRALIPASSKEAREAVTKLAETLRATLSSGEVPLISLRQELQVVRDYLSIEKLRFGEHLVIVEEIDPDTLDAAIPPLLLLTIVENAIKHGVQHHDENAVLTIRSRIEGEEIALSVCSPGTPHDGEKSPPSSSDSLGIGLRNVRERLRLLFGEQTAATLASELSGEIMMTHCQLRFPKRVIS